MSRQVLRVDVVVNVAVVDVAVNVAVDVAVVPSMLLVFVNCTSSVVNVGAVTSYKLQYVLVGLMLMWDDVVYVAKALLPYWWWWLLPWW